MVDARPDMARRVAGIALSWGLLWFAAWLVVCGTIGVVDPDSLDPGDWEGLLSVMTPMGLFIGLVFALLVSRAARGASAATLPSVQLVGWGMLATAIVQVFYLGHGDAGLLSNLAQAAMFSVGGGLVTLVWCWFARRFEALRSPRAVGR